VADGSRLLLVLAAAIAAGGCAFDAVDEADLAAEEEILGESEQPLVPWALRQAADRSTPASDSRVSATRELTSRDAEPGKPTPDPWKKKPKNDESSTPSKPTPDPWAED
jgi:hypothetical protein